MSALAAVLLALPALPAGAHAVARGGDGDGGSGALAVGSGGAVASMDAGASQAGIDVLEHGGRPSSRPTTIRC